MNKAGHEEMTAATVILMEQLMRMLNASIRRGIWFDNHGVLRSALDAELNRIDLPGRAATTRIRRMVRSMNAAARLEFLAELQKAVSPSNGEQMSATPEPDSVDDATATS